MSDHSTRGEKGQEVSSFGNFGGSVTYPIDLWKMLQYMKDPKRDALLRQAQSEGRGPLDLLEEEVRDLLARSAAEDGRPPPVFERFEDMLMVTVENAR